MSEGVQASPDVPRGGSRIRDPRAFYGGLALLVLGVILSVIGLMSARRNLVRGPLFITLSVLIFAMAVRPLGLVIASYFSILAASFATHEVRPLEALIWSAVLSAFCVLLFPIA